MEAQDETAASQTFESGQQESLGTLLRTARQTHDLSIDKIADELRIDVAVLTALEEDRLTDIKVAPVFLKGYIKQYGRQLKLDYAELRSAYQAQVQAEDVELLPNRAIFLRDERQITVWIVAALILLIVAVILFVWWIDEDPPSAVIGTQGVSPDSPVATTLAPAAPSLARPGNIQAAPRSTAEESAPEATLPVAASTDATRVGDTVPSSPLSGAASLPDAAVAVRDNNRADSASTSLASSSGLSESPAPRSQLPVISTERPEDALAVQFQFRADSWLELTDARGRRLFYDIAPAGSEASFYPVPPVNVLLGNADAVDISVEGRRFAVPQQGRRGNLVNFVIAQAQD